MGNTKQTKACAVRDSAPVHLCKVCPEVFLIWGGRGARFELGDVSGGGEGGRRKGGTQWSWRGAVLTLHSIN